VQKHFYLESEWRHIPRNDNIKAYLRADTFENPEHFEITLFIV
jgi:hypothetical protein